MVCRGQIGTFWQIKKRFDKPNGEGGGEQNRGPCRGSYWGRKVWVTQRAGKHLTLLRGSGGGSSTPPFTIQSGFILYNAGRSLLYTVEEVVAWFLDFEHLKKKLSTFLVTLSGIGRGLRVAFSVVVVSCTSRSLSKGAASVCMRRNCKVQGWKLMVLYRITEIAMV